MMEDQLAVLQSMTMEQKNKLVGNMKEMTDLIRICTAKQWLCKPGIEPTYHILKKTPETIRMKELYNDMTLAGVKLIDKTK